MNVGIYCHPYPLGAKTGSRFGDDVVRVVVFLRLLRCCVAVLLCLLRCCVVVLFSSDDSHGGEISGRPALSFAAFHDYSRFSTMPFSGPSDKSCHFFLSLAFDAVCLSLISFSLVCNFKRLVNIFVLLGTGTSSKRCLWGTFSKNS